MHTLQTKHNGGRLIPGTGPLYVLGQGITPIMRTANPTVQYVLTDGKGITPIMRTANPTVQFDGQGITHIMRTANPTVQYVLTDGKGITPIMRTANPTVQFDGQGITHIMRTANSFRLAIKYNISATATLLTSNTWFSLGRGIPVFSPT